MGVECKLKIKRTGLAGDYYEGFSHKIGLYI